MAESQAPSAVPQSWLEVAYQGGSDFHTADVEASGEQVHVIARGSDPQLLRSDVLAALQEAEPGDWIATKDMPPELGEEPPATGTAQYVGRQNPRFQEVASGGFQNFLLNVTPGQILTLPEALAEHLIASEPDWQVPDEGWVAPKEEPLKLGGLGAGGGATGTVQYVGAQNPHSEVVNIDGFQNFLLNVTPGQILTVPQDVANYLVGAEPNWWVPSSGWGPPPAAAQTNWIAKVFSTYTVTNQNGQVLGDPTSGGSFAVTLTDATVTVGQLVTIKHVGSANSITVTPVAGQSIDGNASVTLSAGQALTLYSDGSTTWRVIAQVGNPVGLPNNIVTTTSPDSAIPPNVQLSDVAIDVCRPWGIWAAVLPGQDASAKVQAIIDYIASLTVPVGLIYFSQAGTYLWNNAMQTGTAVGQTYAGQVLFPAVPLSSASMTFAIMGCGPGYMNSGQSVSNGVVLQSNSSSTGNMFDVIPAFGGGGGAPAFSNIEVYVERLGINANVATGNLGGLYMWRAAKFSCRRCSISSGSATSGGSAFGLCLPGLSNQSLQTCEDVYVSGFPICWGLSDHACLQGECAAGPGGIGYQMLGSGNPAHLVNAVAHGCAIAIDGGPSGANTPHGGIIYGQLHVESGGLSTFQLINDPNNFIQGGKLFVSYGTSNPTGGPLSIGGVNLDIQFVVPHAQSTVVTSDIAGRGAGWMATHPADDFQRSVTESSAAQIPGICSLTGHPYTLTGSSAFSRTQGSGSVGTIQSTLGSGLSQALVPALRGGVSRVIPGFLTPGGGTHSIRVIGHYIFGGANNGNDIEIRFVNGAYQLIVSGDGTVVNLAAQVSAGILYAVQLALDYGVDGLPYRARGYLTALLSAPAAPTLAQGTGGSLADGTYKVETTYTNAYGETFASAISTIVITGGGGTATIQVTSPAAALTGYPAVATGYNAYISQAGGSTLSKQNGGTPVAIGTPYTQSTTPTTGGGALPLQDSSVALATKLADHFISAVAKNKLRPRSLSSTGAAGVVMDGFGFNSDTASTITAPFEVKGLAGRTDPNPVGAIGAYTATGGGTVTIDASAGPWITVTVTDNNAYTFALTGTPSSGQTTELTIEALNSSGGAMGAITWGSGFGQLTAGGPAGTWANPANTKKRNVKLQWNGAKMIPQSISSADYS